MSRACYVQCPHCRGAGVVQLSGVYARTLEALKRRRGEVNGAELARLDGCKASAMNNRLVRLETLGLASGRRDGRQRLWKAVAS